MNVVMIGPFGLHPKATLSFRALPMAKALVGRGHRVTLLIPPWDHPLDAGREWQEDGVRIVNLSLPPRLPLFFHILLTLRLVRWALAQGPDVIHLFKPKAYAGLAHLLLWWLRRLRLVGRSLSPGVRLVLDEDDWERAWNAVEAYSPAQKRFFSWQERWGLTHADAVVVASRELVALVEGEGVPSQRIFYVPNGVVPLQAGEAIGRSLKGDSAQTVRMLWELDDALVVLLYTRFFEFTLERIVRILRGVVAQMPDAKLFVVGEGLFGQEADLDEMLAAADLADYAIFTGWVETEHLAGYFAASDVAVFPIDDTLINRTKCSVKLTNLLAAGLPVAADGVGQATEYIADGESGLTVGPEDDEALAEAVVRLLKDADLRARLGAAAGRRMRGHFAWERLVDEVEKAYQF
jgi:glycosyltransferase involved in cell wall biosynthesis